MRSRLREGGREGGGRGIIHKIVCYCYTGVDGRRNEKKKKSIIILTARNSLAFLSFPLVGKRKVEERRGTGAHETFEASTFAFFPC